MKCDEHTKQGERRRGSGFKEWWNVDVYTFSLARSRVCTLSVSLSLYIFSMGVCKELAYVIMEAQPHSLLSMSWRPRKAAYGASASAKA